MCMVIDYHFRSHCACDDEFFSCLRRLNTPIARMIGNIYFNVIQVPCIEEDSPLALPPAKFQVPFVRTFSDQCVA